MQLDVALGVRLDALLAEDALDRPDGDECHAQVEMLLRGKLKLLPPGFKKIGEIRAIFNKAKEHTKA